MLETIYKTKQKRGYINKRFRIVDTSETSPNYFNIYSVPTVFTAGKNVIRVGADGRYLKRNYDIDLEVLDVNGDPIYNEYTNFRDRYGYHYLIVYVYDTAGIGVGTVTLVGVAEYDLNGNPLKYNGTEHVEQFNVRWSTKVDIKATDRNTSDIVFQKAPEVTVSQVLAPYKFNFGTYALNSRLTTQSLEGVEIVTSVTTGLDFIQNTSVDIQTNADVENTYNYFLQSSTANTVETNIRKYNKDIISGFTYSEFSRFNTILYDSQSRLTKDMEGSVFSFANNDNGASMTSSWQYPAELSGEVLSYLTLSGSSGSLPTQLAQYTPKIAYVINNKYALLDRPLTLKVYDTQDSKRPIVKDYIVKRLYNATGSFSYPTSSLVEVQSTNLSSSYIQFTFMDLDPISGDVYRIKTFAKEAGRNAEYFQLNDHIVRPPEFLIDTDKQNQAVYAKNKSDFFTYGEFTTSSIAIDYWRGFSVENGAIYQFSLSNSGSSAITNYPLANALVVGSTATIKRGIASRYYQTYIPNQPYSLSFYCALDPGCELEVYMSSTPLKDNVLGLQAPKAFNQSRGETTAYSKFGKLVGKISNASGSALRHYDNVIFDFYPDSDGFGRPVLFLNTTSTTTKNAYVSSISITPLDLVGYTPSILQFAATTPDSINILQDDDASLTQSLDLKIEYFTADGKQSEYVTYIPNVQINMINEIPGFCSSEAANFNDQAPLYYEVATTSQQMDVVGNIESKPNTNTSSLYPTDWSDCYFWPTFSLNFAGGYNWNMNSFRIVGTTYTRANLVYSSGSQITSSWYRYDPRLPIYDEVANGYQVPSFPNGALSLMYSGTAAGVYTKALIDEYLAEDGGAEARPFYEADGVAINKYDIAYTQSILLQYSNSLDILSDANRKANLQRYLRSTRLHFPATSSTYLYGFHENGGIYNVRFKISKVPAFKYTVGPSKFTALYPNHNSTITANTQVSSYNKITSFDQYEPETGSKLMVYIADVATPLSNLELVPGREGFYPPSSNIVTIGNGYGVTPTIRFYDSGSGYNVDTYDIVLVQYGDKGQLVFDASGLDISLDTNGYYKIASNNAFWGGVVSDIEWCKIGITTDPAFLKPSNFNNQFSTFVPFTPPPPPPPPSGVGGVYGESNIQETTID